MGSAGGRGDSLTRRAPVPRWQVWFERAKREIISSLTSVGVCSPAQKQGCVCVCGSGAGQDSRCLDASLFLSPVARLVELSSPSPEPSLP